MKNILGLLFALTFFIPSISVAQTYIRGNNLIETQASTATGATTTTLTKSSQTNQDFTGSTTQTVVLPSASTLDVGRRFYITNHSTGTVTVKFGDGSTTALALPGGTQGILIVESNGSTNGTWNVVGLTSSTSVVPVASGGTGLSQGTSGGILGFTGTTTLASSAALTANQLIIGGGSGATPSTLAAGSQYQALVMGSSTPGYAALNLAQSAAVTGVLGLTNGGTNVTSVTIAPTGSSFAGWDANSNLSANAFLGGYQAIVSAAATTTLTVASPIQTYVTGSTTQTIKLPVTNTLVVGEQFIVTNLSTGTATVTSSGANTLQAMAQNTQLIATVISTSGTGTASWNWAYQAVQNSLAGGGTVSSVTFTGDGVVDSSTPSSAVTSSGSVTATIINQTKNTFLAGPTSGSNAAPSFRVLNAADYTAPVYQAFTTTGSTVGYMFTISSGSATTGWTYTNNGHTYTVAATIASQTQIWMSGASAPTGSGTLTCATGCSGNLTFSSAVAYATYTMPTSPSALYCEIVACGGGGGGASSGTGNPGSASGGNGSATQFGYGGLIVVGPGLGGAYSGGTGGTGGSCSQAAGAIGTCQPGTTGEGAAYNNSVANENAGGEGGGNSFTPGGVGGGAGSAAPAATNACQGAGGGGSNGNLASFSGSGGGGSGYTRSIVAASTIGSALPYFIGTFGSAGTGGTSGNAGGQGGAGYGEIRCFFQ